MSALSTITLSGIDASTLDNVRLNAGATRLQILVLPHRPNFEECGGVRVISRDEAAFSDWLHLHSRGRASQVDKIDIAVRSFSACGGAAEQVEGGNFSSLAAQQCQSGGQIHSHTVLHARPRAGGQAAPAGLARLSRAW